MLTLLCEDSISGVFSAVYEAWAGGYRRDELRVRVGAIDNYELFMEYKRIATVEEHAGKVAHTILRRFGEHAYESICYAIWSDSPDKADAVYRMIRYGIEHKCGYELHNHLTEDSIRRVFELRRASYHEAHRYLGFLQFTELENGLLYGVIEPEHYILEPVAMHFADRLPQEGWIVYDKTHQRTALHPAGGMWIVTEAEQVLKWIQAPYSAQEEEFRQMWKSFCTRVSIDARENLKLQRQNLPLRFKKNMI